MSDELFMVWRIRKVVHGHFIGKLYMIYDILPTRNLRRIEHGVMGRENETPTVRVVVQGTFKTIHLIDSGN
jgi:hypothetical protein